MKYGRPQKEIFIFLRLERTIAYLVLHIKNQHFRTPLFHPFGCHQHCLRLDEHRAHLINMTN